MTGLEIAIITGFIAFFVLLVGLMVRANRRERARKAQAARSLGFHPLETPDPAFADRVFDLHRHSAGAKFELKNVFVKGSPDGQIYIYDLLDSSGESTTAVADSGVALVLPGWDLPRFSIYPMLEMEGKLASAANWLIAWGASRRFPKIDLAGSPDFNRHYGVFGGDPERVERVITPDLMDWLARVGGLAVEAGGDTLLLGQMDMSPTAMKRPLEERIRALVDRAVEIPRLLGK